MVRAKKQEQPLTQLSRHTLLKESSDDQSLDLARALADRRQLHIREALGLVPLHGVRRHLGFGELANGLTEEALLVGGPQVHRMRATLSHGLDGARLLD